jgi:hypothetical protein
MAWQGMADGVCVTLAQTRAKEGGEAYLKKKKS